MSDPSRREWRFYLDDMIDFVGKVLAYTDGHRCKAPSGSIRLGQSVGDVRWP